MLLLPRYLTSLLLGCQGWHNMLMVCIHIRHFGLLPCHTGSTSLSAYITLVSVRRCGSPTGANGEPPGLFVHLLVALGLYFSVIIVFFSGIKWVQCLLGVRCSPAQIFRCMHLHSYCWYLYSWPPCMYTVAIYAAATTRCHWLQAGHMSQQHHHLGGRQAGGPQPPCPTGGVQGGTAPLWNPFRRIISHHIAQCARGLWIYYCCYYYYYLGGVSLTVTGGVGFCLLCYLFIGYGPWRTDVYGYRWAQGSLLL